MLCVTPPVAPYLRLMSEREGPDLENIPDSPIRLVRTVELCSAFAAMIKAVS
jgi:hypothetical protein